MKNKHKDLRDYVLTGLGATGVAIGAAIVVTELPAILITAAGVVIAGGALHRLQSRKECCDDPTCECHDD